MSSAPLTGRRMIHMMLALLLALFLLAPDQAVAQLEESIARAEHVESSMAAVEDRSRAIESEATNRGESALAAEARATAEAAAAARAEAALASSMGSDLNRVYWLLDEAGRDDAVADMQAAVATLTASVNNVRAQVENLTNSVAAASAEISQALQDTANQALAQAETAVMTTAGYVTAVTTEVANFMNLIGSLHDILNSATGIINRVGAILQTQIALRGDIPTFSEELAANPSVEFNVEYDGDFEIDLFVCQASAGVDFGAGASAGLDFAAGMSIGGSDCSTYVDLSVELEAEFEYSYYYDYECNIPNFSLACDSKKAAADAIFEFALTATDDFNLFIRELTQFIDLDLNFTAMMEMTTRLSEYDQRLYAPMNMWWNDGNGDFWDIDSDGDGRPSEDADNPDDDESDDAYDPNDRCFEWGRAEYDNPDSDYVSRRCTSTLPAFYAMMRQISIVKILQTMHIGMLIDAKLALERSRKRQAMTAGMLSRYTPSETACQLDRPMSVMVRANAVSSAMVTAMTYEDTLRRNNHIDLPPRYAAAPEKDGDGILIRSAHASVANPMFPQVKGTMAEQINVLWEEYCTRYFDAELGDQGCEMPVVVPPTAGEDRNLPGMIWGDNQTLNLNDNSMDQLKTIVDSLRVIISPFTPETVPADVVDTGDGRKEIMMRRARDARINAIWNVLGKQVADRVGASGIESNDLRAALGLPADTTNPVIPAEDTASGVVAGGGESIAALRELTGKLRYYDPDYPTRLIAPSAAVLRERLASLTTQSQTTQDWYKRMEEMVFMEASMLAHDLDQLPQPNVSATSKH